MVNRKTSAAKRAIVAISGAALLCYLMSAAAAPRLQTGPDAEITYDGLHRVDKSLVDMAWVKPDLDLTGYNAIVVQSAGIAFRDVAGTSRGRTAQEFPISEADRTRFRETVSEAFMAELEQLERYETTTEPGRDVLLLTGAIIDVVSRVPPEQIGRGGIYLSSVGEATLVLEFRDSMSGEILARVADRRAAESPFVIEANRVTTWAEIRRLAQTWARLLRSRLDEITSATQF